jgi:sporulation protein YlmC with PRC-barrel domain
MKNSIKLYALAWLAAGFLTASGSAADKTTSEKNPSATVHHHFRASTIDGMKVRNAKGEDIGKVRDLVIDMSKGAVVYAALDFGGFLGVGDKLFAVPWSAFRCESNDKEKFLVLDTTKERLEKAPGFDKSHWPDMADPAWSHDIDNYYGNQKTVGR